MTYGENGHQVRSELTTLLRQHRIQQRLGGPGIHTVPESTTAEQRELLGEQIQRYRYATLAWCLHAVVAANPRINLEGTTERSRGPAEELRYRLTRSHQRVERRAAAAQRTDQAAGVPDGRELAAGRQGRRPRRARLRRSHGLRPALLRAVHDRPEGRRRGRPERWSSSTSGTRASPAGSPSASAAGSIARHRSAAVFAAYDEPDYSVDHKGWRPPPAIIDGGPLPGIGGVLQAEHNMLVHLASFPNALNLRRVMDGQRILSHEAARRAPNVAPELIEKWLEREQTYKKLIDETRDVGGLVGSGGPAAAEAANAVGRLRHVHVDEITSPEPLRDLDKLFTRTDARVAAIIEQGVADRLYFVSVKVPRIVDSSGELVSPVRERYVPITAPINTDLLAITRNELRPPPVTPAAPAGAAESRQELRESIDHRPERRAGPSH